MGELIDKAVVARLQYNPNPVVLLSGGIDSTVVAQSLACQYADGPDSGEIRDGPLIGGAGTRVNPRVVISNGFGRFHLRVAAAEAARRGALAAFITGGYPTPGLARWIQATGLSRAPAISRFLLRTVPVPEECVHSLWAGEPFSQIGSRIRGPSPLAAGLADRLHLVSRWLYSVSAVRLIGPLAAAGSRVIYHYRAGFGGSSVGVARRLGWVCLCHHTIAHPAVLQYVVAHRGGLPPAGESGPVDMNWQAIEADIDRADHVLTNSDFVKSTFLHQGWDSGLIDVIYQGVDDEFLSAIPEREPYEGALRLLFAGSFSRRKGGPELAEAMRHLGDVEWRLDVCGPVDSDAAAAFCKLTADPRVSYHGDLLPADLAARMAAAEVFVFPTLAEGSARVVFEALAAGCCVISTPNGGSIVVDGEHGRLIAPGSVQDIVEALRYAASDRARIARIGARNAALVRHGYRQANYGARLFDLYDRLLAR